MDYNENNKFKESIIIDQENNLINNSSSIPNDQKSSLISTEYTEENKNKNTISENNIINHDNNNTKIQNIALTVPKEYTKKKSIVEFKEKEISCKPAKDKEDFFFKKKFLAEEWFRHSNYIDIDLVQEHISSFKYLWCECQNLELICTEKLFNHAMSKPNLFESKNVRNIVRNGIPPKYMHKFLFRLFNITKSMETLINNYQKILLVSLKGYKSEYLDDYVPYFSGLKKLGDCLPVHFLNKSGIKIL